MAKEQPLTVRIYRDVRLTYDPVVMTWSFTWLTQAYQAATWRTGYSMIDALYLHPATPEGKFDPTDRFIMTYKAFPIWFDPVSVVFYTPSLPKMGPNINTVKLAIEKAIEKGVKPPEEPVKPEPEPEPAPIPVFVTPELPWYMSWLGPVLVYLGSLTEAVINFVDPWFQPLRDMATGLTELPAAIIQAMVDKVGDVMGGARDTGADLATNTVSEVLRGTEPWMEPAQANVSTIEEAGRTQIQGAVDEIKDSKEAMEGPAAVAALENLSNQVYAAAIVNFGLHAVIESGTLGQVEFMRDLEPMVLSKLGMDEIVKQRNMIPIQKAVIEPAIQEWASHHPHAIPGAADLINMVVKEKISLDEFKASMLKLGFKTQWSQLIWDAHFRAPDWSQLLNAYYRGAISRAQLDKFKVLVDLDPVYDAIWDAMIEVIPPMSELINERVKEVIDQPTFYKYMAYYGVDNVWADRIWDAHFIPPSLGDLLLAWRRGVIEEGELDGLMVLVDLDPRFKAIFDTRKYIDPSLTLARFMFETGAIDRARLLELVLREGYTPEDAEAVTVALTRFQERRFRTSYLLAMATGVTYGAFTESELTKAVTDAGYQEPVAGWMMKLGETKRATVLARKKGGGPKLLGLGDLKKAYLLDKITGDQLTTELMTRGYEVGDVTILVALLEDEKVTEGAGGRKVALSQAELLNAWRYGELTEDSLRIELGLRGLDQGEIDILVATKKKQWGA